MQVQIHPKFQASHDIEYDIAVIHLNRTIDFDQFDGKVRCACEPALLDQVDQSKCIALGWGLLKQGDKVVSPMLQQIEMPIVDDDECSRFVPDFDATRKFCAGFNQQDKGLW